MRVSLDWLRELCPFDADSSRVAAILTGRGLTVDALEQSGSDTVLDLDIPANRPDCLGHLGVARELSAALGLPLLDLPTVPSESTALSITIADPVLCPRYSASMVSEVCVAPSPDWVVRRLEACGQRSVNNVVDASNLVLLELGHPIHFFDADAVRRRAGGDPAKITIRLAREGERLRTLDGIDRILDRETLVIADDLGPLAIAGVIGGADTEIVESTVNVLIEAACFCRRTVRDASRRLGIDSDAAYRFARGVDPEGAPRAQVRAAMLLTELADGRTTGAVTDLYPGRSGPARLTLHPGEIRRLLGFAPETEAIRQALEALHLAPQAAADGALLVRIPSWRVDLEREADLVEEVARHVGYDRVPSHPPTSAPTEPPQRISAMEESVRDLLSAAGFHETVGYAMLAAAEDGDWIATGAPQGVAIANPIAETLAVLRRSMMPGLLKAALSNRRRGIDDVRLFEVGRCFVALPGSSAAPLEPTRAAFVWIGAGAPRHWSRPARDVDIYDILGLVERAVAALAPAAELRRVDCGVPGLRPKESTGWQLANGSFVGRAGRLHPRAEGELGIPVYVAELELDSLASVEPGWPRHQPLPRLAPVTRDLSLVVEGGLTFSAILAALGRIDAPAPARFEAIDRYEGPELGPGRSSLTIRVILQPFERTLTDAEIEGYRLRLVETLAARLGIGLRG